MPLDIEGIGFREVRFFFTGDYKSLLLIIGSKGASSTYPSLYCFAPKDKLWDVTCPYEKRTMELMKFHRGQKKEKDQKCCRAEPVFSFICILDHVLDVLHWFIRVGDVILCLLITELRKRDKILQIKENMQFTKEKYKNLALLEDQCVAMNVPLKFSIDPKNKTLVWTSLRGTDRKILCAKIDVFALLGQCPKAEVLQKLFCILSSHNEQLRAQKIWNEEEICVFEEECRDYLKTFLTVFLKKDVTPYMHQYACHLGDLLRRHGTLLPFIQEPVEKYNDVNKTAYFRCTDKKTGSAMTQLAARQNRMMLLRNVVNKYRKRNTRKY